MVSPPTVSKTRIDLSRLAGDVRGGVVDEAIGAEVQQVLTVALGACPDDPRAGVPGELHGEVPDPARGPGDEDALAVGEPAAVEQGLPGGEPGDGERRSLHVADSGGTPRKHRRGGGRILSVGAAGDEAEDLLSGGEGVRA